MWAVVFALTVSVLPAVPANERLVDYRPATAVVYNRNSAESKALAQFYANKRSIPTERLIGIDCPESETVTRQQFDAFIHRPIKKAFDKRGWWRLEKGKEGVMATTNKIQVLVLMRGVPLRVSEELPPAPIDPVTKKALPGKKPATGMQNQAGVDSELALLGYLDMPIKGPQTNRYFGKDVPFKDAGLPWMLMVGRIDGPSDAAARRLITDAIEAEKTGLWGRAYVDLAKKTNGGYAVGESWLQNTFSLFANSGIPVVLDPHPPRFATNYPMNDAALYFGWYTPHADGPFKNPAFRLKKGAVACHIHSFSANTLRWPDQNWVGPLVSHGACAVLGNVWEPYLGLTHQLDLFNSRLLAGYTFIEASYMSIKALSWMGTAVGDPLYRPFSPAATFGEKNRDLAYKVFRVAMNRWGQESDKSAFLAKLEEAATRMKSGVLYEALGVYMMQNNLGDGGRVEAYLDDAFDAYTSKSDQLRTRLHKVEFLRNKGRKKEAVAKLKVLEPLFADIPEGQAITVLLQLLDPPPPPAAPAPSAGG